jgi:hypothetical protein
MHIGDREFGALQRFDGQALDLNPLAAQSREAKHLRAAI